MSGRPFLMGFFTSPELRASLTIEVKLRRIHFIQTYCTYYCGEDLNGWAAMVNWIYCGVCQTAESSVLLLMLQCTMSLTPCSLGQIKACPSHPDTLCIFTVEFTLIWRHTVKKSNKCNQCNFASSLASALSKHLKKHSAGYLGQIKACIFLMIRPKSSACHTTGCHYFIHPVLTACNLSQI